MTPLSFDPTTARTIVTDAMARPLEAKAKADADAGVFDPPASVFDHSTYWGGVEDSMRWVLYRDTHAKRLARNVRKAQS